MRDFLIILSLLISLVFIAFNYTQFKGIYRELSYIEMLGGLQKDISGERVSASGFYSEIIRAKDSPGGLFETFSEDGFFDIDYQVVAENLARDMGDLDTDLPPLLGDVEKTRQIYNQLNFDPEKPDASLRKIRQWLGKVDEDYVAALGSIQALIKALTGAIRHRLEIIFPIDIVLLLLLFSLWYWLGHDKKKRHLDAIMTLNQDLEKKTSSLLSSQKVMASIYDDMRQEKARALTLANDNEQLASIVQQANDAIFRLDLDGCIHSVNDAARSLFEYSPNEMNGRKFVLLFCENDRCSAERAIVDVVESSQSRVVHLAPDVNEQSEDSGRVYEVAFSGLRDTHDQLIGVIAIVRDISYQYREVEQLRQIIYQAPNALVMVNYKGIIVLSNEKADQLFGYSEAELLGEEVEKLVPDYYRNEHRVERNAFIKAPKPRVMGQGKELRLKRKDGTLIPVEIGLGPISARDRNYTIASIMDLSETVSQKDALNRINQQLSEKNREMEQFIYTVSHDLRSPLVTINAFSKKLAVELDGKLSEKQAHRLARIHANVSHMEQLLTDLLSLSRVIKRELVIETLDTSRLVAKLLNTLEAEIQAVDADILVKQPLLNVHANESLFYQCLQNLVVNAIKYRDPGRRLHITIATEKKDQMTGIVVEDNGMGIDPRYQDLIFGIFERLEEGAGTGVGLAIVNTIVDKHNGRIALDSEPGVGSRFTLYFPD